jgi:hypothetical protein
MGQQLEGVLMRRRDLLTMLGGSMAVWPALQSGLHAPQRSQPPLVGMFIT